MLYSLKNEVFSLKKRKKERTGMWYFWSKVLFLEFMINEKNFGSFYNVILHLTSNVQFLMSLRLGYSLKQLILLQNKLKKQTKPPFSSCLDSLLEITFPFTSPTIPNIECQMLVSLKDRTLDNLNTSKLNSAILSHWLMTLFLFVHF
jgi:hypothetical protein